MIYSILIIDDSPDMHRLIRSIFAEEPWRIESAYRGSEGLDLAEAMDPDLILLDLDLPDMNGFEVCRHLKADPLSSRASVVFLTTLSEPDEKVLGLKLQAVDYLTKPFDSGELLARAEAALRFRSIMDMIPASLTNVQFTNG